MNGESETARGQNAAEARASEAAIDASHAGSMASRLMLPHSSERRPIGTEEVDISGFPELIQSERDGGPAAEEATKFAQSVGVERVE